MTNQAKKQANEIKASNNLQHTAVKIVGSKKIIVKIRLNDECKNGHQDFSITADIYEKRGNGQYSWAAGGCCHDEILKHFPQFKIFVDLHSSDFSGAPMYAVSNGFYHLKNSDKQTVLNYLRINEDLYNKLYLAEDKEYFKYLLYKLGIVKQWEAEAKNGISTLENLTQTKFVNDSTRSQIEPLTVEEVDLIESRIKEAYYTVTAIELRKEEAKQASKAKQIEELKASFVSDKTKLENELSVKLFLLQNDFSIDNFIYYNHKNEGLFNWLGYEAEFSECEFNRLLALDMSELPTGIQFKRGIKHK